MVFHSVQGIREVMLANAETRERRQKRLEHFFREAYALTFGLRPGEKRRRSQYEDEGEGGQVRTIRIILNCGHSRRK